MPVSSNALPTPSSCCDANGPNWKTRQLLVMVPGWWPYMLRWKKRKEIWTNSMHAGRNSERRQPICRIPALDEVLAQSLPYYPFINIRREHLPELHACEPLPLPASLASSTPVTQQRTSSVWHTDRGGCFLVTSI